MDTTQLLLIALIIILTAMMGAICIQLYWVLQEFRKTLVKANKVLDDTAQITESVSRPVSAISALLTGMKSWSDLKKKKSND